MYYTDNFIKKYCFFQANINNINNVNSSSIKKIIVI